MFIGFQIVNQHTAAKLPQPPNTHVISILTDNFQLIYGATVNINIDSPRQDPQKTSTRHSPCLQQGCLICSTPINHVRNLDVSPINHVRNLDVSPTNHFCNPDVSLNNINGPPNSATSLNPGGV